MQFALDLDFTEQVDFFRKKLNLPTARWDDIWQAQHDRAFVVAGAMNADLLDDLRLAVDKGVAQGMDIDEFRKDFWQIVEKHGWRGWTGDESDARREWRIRTIFETNVNTSYAAGRYAQLTDPDLLSVMPYWRYVHAEGVLSPRPQHLAWDGLVLHHTHPFWQTHYPPNGWGCGCTVEAAEGPGEGDKTEPPEGWDTPDDKGRLPGVDRGWAYAPGRSAAEELRQIVDEKTEKYPEQLAMDFLSEMEKGGVLPAAAPQRPASVEDFIEAGKKITQTLPAEPEKLHPALMERLEKEVGAGESAAALTGKGRGAELVRKASRRYPKAWVEAANDFGELHAKLNNNGRAWHATLDNSEFPIGIRGRLQDFGVVTVGKNPGYIVVRDDLPCVIHEYAHRLQSALPQLQEMFKELHNKRTAGMALESLKTLKPLSKYEKDELTRRDHYIDVYWGKDYNGEPKEVMTMALQTVLSGYETKESGEMFGKLYNDDREMFDFVVGLLFNWKP
jgi:hypothetical protein